MKELYVCEKCGKMFDNSVDAYTCEEEHAVPATWINDRFRKAWDARFENSRYSYADAYVSDFAYHEGQQIPYSVVVYMQRMNGEGKRVMEGYTFTSKSQTPSVVIDSEETEE